ncbi:anaphase-promoting complex subunit 2-like [Ornithodoros turicata]|uniref:anaphase-promoting complex subunit 2-like n=1 Tax=Ornithodoros turicata TaxID=34597 RepID=UPI0031390B97
MAKAMSNIQLSEAWKLIEAYVSSPNETATIESNKTDICEALQLLHQRGAAQILCPWFLRKYQHDLRHRIVPTFWSHITDADGLTVHQIQDSFENAVTYLVNEVEAYKAKALLIQSTQRHASQDTSSVVSPGLVHDKLRAVLFSSVPPHFNQVLLRFYTSAFRAFHKVSGEEDSEETLECVGCEEVEYCKCTTFIEKFRQINIKLCTLNLMDGVSQDAASTVAYKFIEQHLQSTCKGNFENRYLHTLEEWLNRTVLEWFQLLYKTKADYEASPTMSSLKDHLSHFLYDTYVNVRMDQLFNIIIEFPESQAALEDLKECLEKTNLKPKVIHSLKSAMQRRLLHPGVNTVDILTAYISAIKALRVLDSTGYILQLVCEPVCRYLRTREDTVRCIVSNLTDENCIELAGELVKFTPITTEDNCESEEDDENWENWQPDPVGNEQVQVSKGVRTSDIVSMLVNIYGSKELFASEYESLLAQRLLFTCSLDTEREVRYLECLKLRFGESLLHSCEVMLRDVADSKRLNAHLSSGELPAYHAGEFEVSAVVISAQFWPTLTEEKLVLPPEVQNALDNYTKAFETIKGNRTLQWKPHLGQVELEVEIGNKVLTFSVSPIHATIIYHFQEKSRWTLDELSSVTHVTNTVLRRKLALWQSQGLIREEEVGLFVLVEDGQPAAPNVEVEEEDDEEAQSVTASTQDQKESDLQMYWSYIIGMLTNLEALTLERIHTMLKMFAMQTPSTAQLTVQELRQFLDSQVSKQKLLYSGGQYKLPKSDTV